MSETEHVKGTRIQTCPRCSSGYCAPLRCYCGHSECESYAAGWRDLHAVKIDAAALQQKSNDALARAWADRQESSWLDND